MPSIEPTALRLHRLFESTDLDDTRARISAVMQPHSLEPTTAKSQSGRAHMDFVRCGQIGIGAIAFGCATRVTVESVSGYHLVMFCLTGCATVRIDGHTAFANAQTAVLCEQGCSFQAELSHDCEQLVLRIGAAALRAHTGVNRLRTMRQIDLAASASQPWLHQLRALVSSPELLRCASQHHMIAAEIERLLISLMLMAELRGVPVQDTLIVPASVRRAQEFIEAHAGSAVTLADIALAAGVPTRTLLASFRSFTDTTPMQCLRSARLKRARELLLLSGPNASVTEIAYDCGFVHLGRFAKSYAERFGESPSATLRRL
jgi:AraC-like DNA-binding protein